MNKFEKPLLILLIVSFYSSSYAGDLEEQINKACLRHAISLVTKLQTDVVKDLNQNQSDQALKIATDSCQAYLNKEFAETTISNNDSDDKQTDSLTEKILSGEVVRKDGNKRLLKRH